MAFIRRRREGDGGQGVGFVGFFQPTMQPQPPACRPDDDDSIFDGGLGGGAKMVL